MKLLQWRFRPLSGALTLTRASHARRLFCTSTAADTDTTTSTTPQPSSFALKTVTRSNFASALADLRPLVASADFVAVDLEMTGVTSAPWRDSFEFDRSDIRYLKVKDSAEKFAVLQFGVCPFRWNKAKQRFISYPHNFYVFPRQELQVAGPSNEFLCQTRSIDFLARYQFDFNTCINEGVSYLSKRQEDEALRYLNLTNGDELSESGCSLKAVKDMPLGRTSDVFFTERLRNRISEWRGGLLQPRSNMSNHQDNFNGSNQHYETTFYKMRPALKLNCFTSHQLKLIELVTKKHFEDLAYVRATGADSCFKHLIVYTHSKDDRSMILKEVKDELHKEAEMKIKAAAGFRQVIDLLSSEQKLIVGHNCLLDIAQIYSKFVDHLPSTAEEFASSVHKNFPCIIDTKVLLNENTVLQHLVNKSSTSLSKAFSLLCYKLESTSSCQGSSSLALKPSVKVEVQVDDLSFGDWNFGAKHEAGYDAFMTGCIFAQSCCHLDINLDSQSANLAHNDKLQKQINRINFCWKNGEVMNLSTGNWDAEASGCNKLRSRHPKILFSNVVLIWGFPSKLKAREIKECISKVFGPSSVTAVFRLDETAVFVHFNKAELVSDFLSLKETVEGTHDPISVLHPLSQLLDGGNTCAASYDVYREICSSPISKALFADQAEAVGIKWKTKYVESKVEVEAGEHEMLSNDEENTASV